MGIYQNKNTKSKLLFFETNNISFSCLDHERTLPYEKLCSTKIHSIFNCHDITIAVHTSSDSFSKNQYIWDRSILTIHHIAELCWEGLFIECDCSRSSDLFTIQWVNIPSTTLECFTRRFLGIFPRADTTMQYLTPDIPSWANTSMRITITTDYYRLITGSLSSISCMSWPSHTTIGKCLFYRITRSHDTLNLYGSTYWSILHGTYICCWWLMKLNSKYNCHCYKKYTHRKWKKRIHKKKLKNNH